MDIDNIQKIVENDGIIFLSYGGYLSQVLISGMTEAIEREVEDNNLSIGSSSNIFTIFIELSQNMMNYSKSINEKDMGIKPQGLILVAKDKDLNYYIHSQNIVSQADKDKIEPKLQEIASFDKDGLKKRYRELRKSGQNKHGKGGGIGFYEIAKKCDSIEYAFTPINDDRYYFHIKTNILTNREQ